MRSHQIPVGGTDVAVFEAGEGLPLLLVHGFPFNHTMWRAQIEALSGRCHVVVPDLPGFGASGLPGETVTMEQFADTLAELLDRLNVSGPVVFCGLSMGGYIAWQFWARHSHRLKALILCDTRATADTPEAVAFRHRTAEQVLREGTAPLVEAMLPKLFAPAILQRNAEPVQHVRQMILEANPAAVAAALRGMGKRPDMTGKLGQIRCPTLVIVGEHDAISPPGEMQQIAQAIPGAKFVTIEAAGHMTPLENPAAVNQAIDRFLGELESG